MLENHKIYNPIICLFKLINFEVLPVFSNDSTVKLENCGPEDDSKLENPYDCVPEDDSKLENCVPEDDSKLENPYDSVPEDDSKLENPLDSVFDDDSVLLEKLGSPAPS